MLRKHLIVDTHTHICDSSFDADRGEVLKKAAEAGIGAIIAVEAGFFFSIPPSVVRSRQKQKLVRHLPLSCLLVETDSPVLGPDPKQRNETANVTLAIKAIMELKSAGEDEVLEAVCANTERLMAISSTPRDTPNPYNRSSPRFSAI